MPLKKDIVVSGAVGQSGKIVRVGPSPAALPPEFRERFDIPNGVFVQLVEGDVVSTEKIPPALLNPNVIRVLMGCSILYMLFSLDLSLLEVLFVYTIKKGKNNIFSISVGIPSLQLVIDLPNSIKGVARGHVLVKGSWGGLLEHREKEFVPNQSLKIPALFNRLNKLFEIAAGERNYQTLFSARNLWVVTQVSQPYTLNIIPRRLPKKVVSGEHFVLQDLPFYTEAREADAQARQERLSQREVKRQEGTLRRAPGEKRPTSLPPTRPSVEKKKMVPIKGISGLPRRVPSQYGSGPSISAFERLALPIEEEPSVDQPDSPRPDQDDMQLLVENKPAGEEVGPSYFDLAPPATIPIEELGVERLGSPPCGPDSLALVPVDEPALERSISPCDLTTEFCERLQQRLHETIEVSCSSIRVEHPEEVRLEIARESPSGPVLISDDDSFGGVQPVEEEAGPAPRGEPSNSDSVEGDSANDIVHISVCPPSCTEMEEMLRRIPHGSDVDLPPSKMFETAEMLVNNIRGMVQRCELFSDLLRVADHMKAFVSYRMGGKEELRLKLQQSEIDLAIAQKAAAENAEALRRSEDDKEALRIELEEVKSREKAIGDRLNEVESEKAQLGGEVRQLRTELSIERKQKEDLQLRLIAQRKELEARFTVQRKKLETEYQKQVDEMYFFGYRCCMKKNDIKRNVPSIPPGEEDKMRRDPPQ
ncbi:hypothetical protein AAG906_038789 [Vitis piasezkii]